MLKFFQKFENVTAVMSLKEDGSMKLFKDGDLNLKNREKFFNKIGISDKNVVSAEIIHGNKAEIILNNNLKMIPGTDALATSEKNIYLSITVADCVPAFFYEPEKKIIAIAHAGWRGIVAGIIGTTFTKILELGSKAENLQVAMGPGINACHFEIKENIVDKFAVYSSYVIKRDNKIFVDLKGILKRQLLNLGVKEENIENNNDCTFENGKYFSSRRDKPQVIEAMIAVIGMK